MSTFEERERGQEAKFANDQAEEFRATARRNRLLGLWAGGLMGLENEHLQDYAAAIVRSEVVLPNDVDVQRKLTGDLIGSGLKINEDQVRAKMDELQAVARQQIQDGI
jgi:hypothetical protein